jgi:hAT family C-terminal dimerisation region
VYQVLISTNIDHHLTTGSAVAVERIFSGGRDTISLRRASLDPETIRTLMLVKQRLRLARTAINELLGD